MRLPPAPAPTPHEAMTGLRPTDAERLPPLTLTRRGRFALGGLAAIAIGILATGVVLVVRAGDDAELPAREAIAAEPREDAPEGPTWDAPTVRSEPGTLLVTAADAVALSAEAAEALFEHAPVVVVSEQRAEPVEAAGVLALRLRAPLLLVDPPTAGPGVGETEGATAEPAMPSRLDDALRALAPSVIVAVGAVPALATDAEVREVTIADDVRAVRRADWEQVLGAINRAAGPRGADTSEIDDLLAAAAEAAVRDPSGAAVLHRSDVLALAPAISAVAAGRSLVPLADTDPRADHRAIDRLASVGSASIVVLGGDDVWGGATVEDLAWRLETAATGVHLPGGGQLLFPGRQLIALYGHPEGPALGVLGEQPVDRAVTRAREVAAPYDALVREPVVPTFEIITTIASAGAGSRGDYSRRTPIETLRPWVDAAAEAGMYVVLDLQPGRTDFLSQAQEYEELLRQPHVGLALDPEWRLRPNQVHLRQIGGVDAAEVNAVADWLAGLTRENRLPQKLFIVHQFKFSMIRDRASMRADHPELATLIQMDGQGSQGSKDGTYRSLVTQDSPPPGVWWGWKNFYDEDTPGVRSPGATMAVDPRPWFVSYQ